MRELIIQCIKEQATQMLASSDVISKLGCYRAYTCNAIALTYLDNIVPSYDNINSTLAAIGKLYAKRMYSELPNAIKPVRINSDFINQFIEISTHLFDTDTYELRKQLRIEWLTYLANLEEPKAI